LRTRAAGVLISSLLFPDIQPIPGHERTFLDLLINVPIPVACLEEDNYSAHPKVILRNRFSIIRNTENSDPHLSYIDPQLVVTVLNCFFEVIQAIIIITAQLSLHREKKTLSGDSFLACKSSKRG